MEAALDIKVATQERQNERARRADIEIDDPLSASTILGYVCTNWSVVTPTPKEVSDGPHGAV